MVDGMPVRTAKMLDKLRECFVRTGRFTFDDATSIVRSESLLSADATTKSIEMEAVALMEVGRWMVDHLGEI